MWTYSIPNPSPILKWLLSLHRHNTQSGTWKERNFGVTFCVSSICFHENRVGAGMGDKECNIWKPTNIIWGLVFLLQYYSTCVSEKDTLNCAVKEFIFNQTTLKMKQPLWLKLVLQFNTYEWVWQWCVSDGKSVNLWVIVDNSQNSIFE